MILARDFRVIYFITLFFLVLVTSMSSAFRMFGGVGFNNFISMPIKIEEPFFPLYDNIQEL